MLPPNQRLRRRPIPIVGRFLRATAARWLLLPLIVVLSLCVGLIQPGATAQASALGTAGLFLPVQGRLVSTLAGTGTTKAPLAASTPRTIQGTGAAGIPSSGVEALLVTFTAVDPTTAGQASVGPTGGALSGAMQYAAGEPTSNSAIVQLSSSGQFQIQTTTVTNVNIDVQGYYTSGSGTAAGGYVPVPFTRTVNTATGVGLPQATLAGGTTSTIQVTGTAGVPAGAAAVFVDFEVQNQNTTAGNITAYAASAPRPTSTLNFGVGKTSMSTIVPVDANGQIKVFLTSGNTINLLMDVEGYFTAGSITQSSGSIFTPNTAKIYDTRSGTAVAAGATVSIPVGGTNGIPTVAQGLSAITANITAINTTTVSTGSYVRLYPSDQAEPQGVATTFNSGPAGQATTNLVTVQVGADGAIMLHNVSTIPVNYILDLEGWYTTSNPDPTTPEVTGSGGSYVATSGRLPKVYLAANVPQSVQLAGLVGVPDTGAGAVSIVVSIVSATTQGTLSAQATGDLAWSQVAEYGTITGAASNTAVLALGGDGTITFQASSDVGLWIDVQGYYTITSNGTPAPGGFSPLAGSRLVDTRSGLGAPQAQIAPGGSITIPVAGNGGVPANAQAVIANFTAVTTETNYGYMTPYPTGSSRPSLSLNYAATNVAGVSVATAVSAQVSLGTNGSITVANPSTTGADIDLIVDIQGYFTAGDGTKGLFTPATGRIYDSRVAPNTTIGADQTITVPISGQANVPSPKLGLSAVVIALTAIDSTTSSSGYARLWASGTTEPNPSGALNYPANSVRTNTVTVPVGADGAIKIHNIGTATVDYVLDLQGWYTSPPQPTITCPSDFTNGGWTNTLPNAPITCNVSLPDTGDTDGSVAVSVDGADESDLSIPASGALIYSATVPATAGWHVVNVSASYSDGDTAQTSFAFGDQDGAPSPLVAAVENARPDALANVTSAAPMSSGPVAVQTTATDSTNATATVASDPGAGLTLTADPTSVTDPTDGSVTTSPGSTIAVQLPFATTASDAHSEAPGIVSFDNHNGSSTVSVVHQDASVQNFNVIENASAPTTYTYPMDLPAGATLTQNDDGSISATATDGTWLGGVAPAWAKDANGQDVPTHYVVSGNSVQQVVDLSSTSITYPVVADPWFGIVLIDHTHWANTWQYSPTLQITPTDYGRNWASVLLVDLAWSQTLAKTARSGHPNPNTGTMWVQFECHWDVVRVINPNKATWDLDTKLPQTNLLNEIRHGCNYKG